MGASQQMRKGSGPSMPSAPGVQKTVLFSLGSDQLTSTSMLPPESHLLNFGYIFPYTI